jgi:hypothetical protein
MSIVMHSIDNQNEVARRLIQSGEGPNQSKAKNLDDKTITEAGLQKRGWLFSVHARAEQRGSNTLTPTPATGSITVKNFCEHFSPGGFDLGITLLDGAPYRAPVEARIPPRSIGTSTRSQPRDGTRLRAKRIRFSSASGNGHSRKPQALLKSQRTGG